MIMSNLPIELELTSDLIKKVLHYIYSDSVKMDIKDAPELYKFSKTYHLPGLEVKISNHLKLEVHIILLFMLIYNFY